MWSFVQSHVSFWKLETCMSLQGEAERFSKARQFRKADADTNPGKQQ
jgi:hypothetical protein